MELGPCWRALSEGIRVREAAPFTFISQISLPVRGLNRQSALWRQCAWVFLRFDCWHLSCASVQVCKSFCSLNFSFGKCNCIFNNSIIYRNELYLLTVVSKTNNKLFSVFLLFNVQCLLSSVFILTAVCVMWKLFDSEHREEIVLMWLVEGFKKCVSATVKTVTMNLSNSNYHNLSNCSFTKGRFFDTITLSTQIWLDYTILCLLGEKDSSLLVTFVYNYSHDIYKLVCCEKNK